MSDDISLDDARNELAELTGRSTDPLADLTTTFDSFEYDPLDLFLSEFTNRKDWAGTTIRNYEYAYRDWREHMRAEGRHPACPNEQHIWSFIERLREDRGLAVSTVRTKLRALNSAYEFWQRDSVFPHPTDYNPFRKVMDEWQPEKAEKDYPRVSLDELQDRVASVTHIRDRAIIVLQLKLGLRASEVANIRIEDIAIEHSDIEREYPSVGTHDAIRDHDDTIYIPARDERDGNKSKRPRLLPLDDEVRRV